MTTQEQILASFKELEQDAKDVADFMALAEMVKAAKVERKSINVNGSEPFGDRVLVGPTTYGSCNLYVMTGLGFTATVTPNRQDLLTIAAHCLAAAEELDELQKPK